MNQNRKLSVRSIWAKLQNFEEFFKQCVYLIGLPLVKISARSNIIWGNKSQKNPKRAYFKDAESIQGTLKNFNFTSTYAISVVSFINLPQIYIVIRSFIWQNIGVFIEYKRAWTKKLTKWAKNLVFWPNFDHFLILQ